MQKISSSQEPEGGALSCRTSCSVNIKHRHDYNPRKTKINCSSNDFHFKIISKCETGENAATAHTDGQIQEENLRLCKPSPLQSINQSKNVYSTSYTGLNGST